MGVKFKFQKLVKAEWKKLNNVHLAGKYITNDERFKISWNYVLFQSLENLLDKLHYWHSNDLIEDGEDVDYLSNFRCLNWRKDGIQVEWWVLWRKTFQVKNFGQKIWNIRTLRTFTLILTFG